jgi:hypothetical protein
VAEFDEPYLLLTKQSSKKRVNYGTRTFIKRPNFNQTFKKRRVRTRF